MKQGPFAHGRFCCPAGHRYYDPLRLPLGRRPLPGVTGYRTARFRRPQRRAEEGLSSSLGTHLTVPLPYAGGFIDTRSRNPGVFHGLHHTLRTGQSLHPASNPASQPNPGASLPGTLASPRTGLSPAGHQELVVRLRHVRSFAVMASELLDARGSRLIGAPFHGEQNSPRGRPGETPSRRRRRTLLADSGSRDHSSKALDLKADGAGGDHRLVHGGTGDTSSTTTRRRPGVGAHVW